jgi:DNA-binding transcriptional regulator GbsR (MarR family)
MKGITLTPLARKFILHWGEMGTRWGINRTVAQVHALLYITEAPLNAEQIAATLQVARSNVSNSLRELQSWGVVKIVHVMGDRRDHFESLKDVWHMFQVVLNERKRREIDPTVAILREAVSESGSGSSDDYARGKMREMLEFFEVGTACYDDLEKLSPSALKKLLKMGGKVGALLR